MASDIITTKWLVLAESGPSPLLTLLLMIKRGLLVVRGGSNTSGLPRNDTLLLLWMSARTQGISSRCVSLLAQYEQAGYP